MSRGESAAAPSQDRDGFRFRGGHAAIDLPATLAGRLKATPRDLLNSAADLDRWLVSAGLAATAPAADDRDLKMARQLREAIFVLAENPRARNEQARAARKTLNAIAAGHPASPMLRPDGSVRLRGSGAALLVTLAHQAIELFGSSEGAQIRQCASDTCTLYFVDSSRAGDRKWCSMSGCGNKAKVAEFRRRSRRSSGVA